MKVTTRALNKYGRTYYNFAPISVNVPYNEKAEGVPNPCSVQVSYSKDSRGREYCYITVAVRMQQDSVQWEYSCRGSIKPSASFENARTWTFIRPPEKIDITTRKDTRKKGYLGIGLSLSPRVECKVGGVSAIANVVVKNQEGGIVHRSSAALDKFVFG